VNCQICSRQISGSYGFNDMGDKICSSHSDAIQCSACLRFLKRRVNRGSSFCGACEAQAVNSNGALTARSKAVLDWLSSEVGKHSFGTIPISLKDEGFFEDDCQGMTKWSSDGTTVRAEIFIRTGLPSVRCDEVIAHEYGHVLLISDPATFQFTGGLDSAQSMEEEGFCELVGYRCIAALGHPDNTRHMRAMESNSNPIYGDGFRAVHALFEQQGSILAVRSSLLGQSITPYAELALGMPFVPNEASPRFPVVRLPGGGIEIRGGSHRPSIDWHSEIGLSVVQPVGVQSLPSDDRPDLDWRQ
jgi:hypothetical protein